MTYPSNNNAINTKAPRLWQVLIPACRIVRQSKADYTWLHGYCLLTCRISVNGVELSGEVDVGDHYAENAAMVGSLAQALKPAAILAGIDLTKMASALGRLPLDSDDAEPALALLSKLRSMIEGQEPIDLSVTAVGRKFLRAERLIMKFACPRDQNGSESNLPNRNGLDSQNPWALAMNLADEGGACLLAMGQLQLTSTQQKQLIAAWQDLRPQLFPLLPNMEVPIEPNA